MWPERLTSFLPWSAWQIHFTELAEPHVLPCFKGFYFYSWIGSYILSNALFLFYVCELPASVPAKHIHTWFLQRPEEGLGSGIAGVFETPCGCQDSNSAPLEEQSVLVMADPSFQHLKCFCDSPGLRFFLHQSISIPLCWENNIWASSGSLIIQTLNSLS